MKKLFKTLVCLTLALVMCFGLTACGEFDGNFKTVASADEINTTFAKVNTEESDTETGYQLKATFKGAFENEQGRHRYDDEGQGFHKGRSQIRNREHDDFFRLVPSRRGVCQL